MPTYYDEFDIAMDWFYEPVLGEGDDEDSDYDDDSDADDYESETEEVDPENAVEDGEGLDSFDLATAELSEDFKELELPWWIETLTATGTGEASMGIHGAEQVGSRQRWVQRFPNATQFLNFIYSPLDLPGRYSVRPSHTGDCLGLTWESARVMADRGWPEGVEKVNAIAAKIKRVVSGAVKVPVTTYGIRGPKIDMGKFLTGDPRHMLVMSESDRMKQAAKPKIVRIVTTVDIASGEGFINRGAAICALSQLLQRHGIRTQIDVHVGTDDKIDTWLRIKDADRGTDMESLVFFTAHPVMFWRYAYAAWEHAPAEYRGLVGTKSMGYISEPVEADRGDVYVSARGSRWKDSETEMLAWVVGELQKAGIEVELEGQKL